MDSDDAPHAGNDSGKHGRIFAEIAVAYGAAPELGLEEAPNKPPAARDHPGSGGLLR
ncbi:hypothetical protein GCM10011496_27460 [Polaromonas eurypsychrophila]|uniref:Uncharacterized protein n=1 Tax=Polaromonas eurypsychrophila TaxID=1614635 RepID=A0A916SLI8_9BURK|nr:hypothetical protein GCM10011496_27460 [Polaromonas eurypsychrophila]